MKFSSRAAIAAFASLMLIGAASAQSPAPAPTPMTKSAPVAKTAPEAKSEAKTAKPRTEVSLECSKQADAKGLHGKERHKFRSDCKKTGGKS
ncbi:PsiF family protein [Tardiphaga sp.]|uniref:PsiF family protein n=1 Tax=Tardiphaga sp. TaxID=1926292 RepID=UPI0026159778|nr:PsiF family protein [Tardiphaga sp.]